MLDEERVERQPVPLGEPAAQRRLGRLGRIGPHDPEAVREPVDVGVDRDPRDPVAEDQHAVRRLRADARQRRELRERPRDGPSESIEDRPGAGADDPGLRPVEPHRVDPAFHLERGGRGERRGVREPREQARRRDVRLLVPRPLREDRPDQDLERVLGVVAQVRPPPVPRPVERREPVEELLPVERRGRRRAHGRAPGRAGAAAPPGAVSVPGSERSGSSAASAGRTSSPIR